jgi:hypothetical protein
LENRSEENKEERKNFDLFTKSKTKEKDQSNKQVSACLSLYIFKCGIKETLGARILSFSACPLP